MSDNATYVRMYRLKKKIAAGKATASQVREFEEYQTRKKGGAMANPVPVDGLGHVDPESGEVFTSARDPRPFQPEMAGDFSSPTSPPLSSPSSPEGSAESPSAPSSTSPSQPSTLGATPSNGSSAPGATPPPIDLSGGISDILGKLGVKPESLGLEDLEATMKAAGIDPAAFDIPAAAMKQLVAGAGGSLAGLVLNHFDQTVTGPGGFHGVSSIPILSMLLQGAIARRLFKMLPEDATAEDLDDFIILTLGGYEVVVVFLASRKLKADGISLKDALLSGAPVADRSAAVAELQRQRQAAAMRAARGGTPSSLHKRPVGAPAPSAPTNGAPALDEAAQAPDDAFRDDVGGNEFPRGEFESAIRGDEGGKGQAVRVPQGMGDILSEKA